VERAKTTRTRTTHFFAKPADQLLKDLSLKYSLMKAYVVITRLSMVTKTLLNKEERTLYQHKNAIESILNATRIDMPIDEFNSLYLFCKKHTGQNKYLIILAWRFQHQFDKSLKIPGHLKTNVILRKT